MPRSRAFRWSPERTEKPSGMRDPTWWSRKRPSRAQCMSTTSFSRSRSRPALSGLRSLRSDGDRAPTVRERTRGGDDGNGELCSDRLPGRIDSQPDQPVRRGQRVIGKYRLLLQFLDGAADEAQSHQEKKRRRQQENRSQRQAEGEPLHRAVQREQTDESRKQADIESGTPAAARSGERVQEQNGLAAFAEHRKKSNRSKRQCGT